MLSQLVALSAKDLLGLTVLGSSITAVGTLVGLALKEHFFARSFELWKSRNILEALFQKYRDPLLLAADELSIRLKEVCDGYGAEYLSSSLLEKIPNRMEVTWASDSYYQRYKLESTVYRLCALFGWFELYRQEVVFLRSSRAKHNRRLESAISAIREVIADGQMNASEDWVDWTDHLIFREEQRAIGAMMITSAGPVRTVMGYGEFSELFRSKSLLHQYRWIEVAARFLLDISLSEKDFRAVRLKALYVHLIDLISALDEDRVRPSHRDKRARYYADLPLAARDRLTFIEKAARVAWIFSRRQTTQAPTNEQEVARENKK